MALAKNKVNISFAQGVDTKTDPKQVIPGKLLTLENAVFQKTNALIKRNGYTALTTTGLTDGIGLSTFKDQLFMLSGQTGSNFINGRVYSPSKSSFSDIKGYYAPINVTRSSCAVLTGLTAPYAAVDHCVDVDSNLEIIVYLKLIKLPISGTVERLFYSVRDTVTGAFVIKETAIPFSIDQKAQIRIVSLAGLFWVFYQGKNVAGTQNSLRYSYIDIENLSAGFSTPVIVANVGTSAGDYADDTKFDVLVDNFIIYVSYADGTASKTLTLKTYNSFGILQTTVAVTGVNANKGSALTADDLGNIWAVANDGINIKAISYTSGLSAARCSAAAINNNPTSLALTNVVIKLDPVTPDKIWVYFTQDYVTNEYTAPNVVLYNTATLVAGSIGLTSQGTVAVNAAVYGQPFIQDNQIKLPIISHDGYATYSLYIVDATYSFTEAKFLTLAANPLRGNPITTWTPTAGNNYLLAVENNADIDAYNAYSYFVTYDHKPVFAEIANNLHITGGFINMFDGNSLAEHGFLQNPSIITAAQGAAGSVPAGSYYYVYTYEWVDAYGQLHISAPSQASAVLTLAGSYKINLTIPCLTLTNKTDQIFIGVYRSSDGTNFYKNRYTGFNSSLTNSTSSGSVTFEDNYTFATGYQGQALVYTNGGEVPNIDPGAVSYLATYNQRLVAIPQEMPSTWWYSKEIVPPATGTAGTPIYFSDEFVSVVDERSGGIVGIQQMDEKLVFFKRTNIFALSGNGPAANGTGNDFNPPQVVATDTGANDNQSLVLGPSGIMFKSAKGFYLIDRSLSVSYIGAPVEAYNSYTVLSSDLIYNLNQFRFGLSNGQALVYNYLFDQWSVFTNHAIVQACIYQNKYTFCKSNAALWQESTGYLDDTANISLKLTTGWLSFGDLQGFQRVYKLMLLGKYKSSHFLTVQVSYDFDDTVTQSTNITVLSTDPYEYRLFLTRQKCTAIKFTILDNIAAGSLNEGYEISAMAFEVGVKQGLNKLAATRSAG